MPTKTRAKAKSEGEKPKPARGLRADAERNRRLVLEVAREVFASEGLDVPIDEIARRAGLGVGTLYRHFATKEALFEAILVDRIDSMTKAAEDLAKADDPGDALFTFFEKFVAESPKKKDLAHALHDTLPDRTAFMAAKKALYVAVEALRVRAQKAGAIRADVTTTDMFVLFRGLLSGTDGDEKTRARHFAIVCDGLRHRPRR